MHHSTLAARLLAGGLLSLVLTSTAAAELTKLQCYTSRVVLTGRVYARVAECSTQADQIGCLNRAREDHATWSGAIELLGCPPWPSETDVLVRAVDALAQPPEGFWDDCGLEAGVCGGACAEPFHACQDDGDGCACVSTLPPGN